MEMRSEENNDYYMFDEEQQTNNRLLTFKQRLYNICYTFVAKSFPSKRTASALISASLIQLLAIMLAEINPTGSFDQKLIRIIRCFRLFIEIEQLGSSVIYYSCICICFAALLFLSINALINCLLRSNSYIASLLPLIFWVCFIPISELLISAFQCNSADQHIVLEDTPCWSFNHIIVASVAGIMLIPWIVIVLLSVLIVSYSQPLKFDPFAHFPWNFEVIYCWLRIVYILNVRVIHLEILQVALIAFTMIYFISLIWNIFPYYDPTISLVFSGGMCSIFCCSFLVLLKYVFEAFHFSYQGLALLVFSIALITFIYISWSKKRWYHKLLTTQKLFSAPEVDAKIHLLFNILANGTLFITSQQIYIDTNTPSLPNTAINESISQTFKSENFYRGDVDSTQKFSQQSNESNKSKERIISIIKYCEKENIGNGSNVQFLLQISGIYLYLMENPHLAYAKILEAEAQNSELILDFAIHLRKLDILSVIEAQKVKINRKLGYGRFQSVIQFEAEYKNLRTKMHKQANLKMDFWNSLKTNPSLNRLHKLGMDMIKLNMEIKDSWRLLSKIHKQNIPMLKIYKKYLKYVAGDNEEVNGIRKQIKSSSVDKIQKSLSSSGIFSERIATIIISADSRIVRANKAAERIFLYNKRQLCGNLISMIMPPMIGKHHPVFLDSYYKSGFNPNGGKPITTFGLNRDGFIIPMKIAKQQFFSLTLGMLYIGAIETDPPLTEEQYIITDTKGVIGGATRQICKRLKMSSSLIADKKVNIKKICPELFDQEINRLIGEKVLNFASFAMDKGALSGPRKRTFSLSRSGSVGLPEDNSANQTNYIQQVLNQNSSREDTGLTKSKIQDFEFQSKCEVMTAEYSSGLVLKIFRIGKIIAGDEQDKAVNSVIGKEVGSSISTILKVLRKFRLIISKSHKEKLNASTQGNSKTDRSVRSSLFRKNSIIAEEQQKSQEATGQQLQVFKDSSMDHISFVSNMSKINLINTSKRCSLSKNEKNGIKKILNAPRMSVTMLDPRFDSMSEASAKTRKDLAIKEITDMRKKTIDEFYPNSVKYMKLASQLFICAVLILLSIRMSISIKLNSNVVDYSPLMVSNGERIFTMAAITMLTQDITAIFPLKGTNITVMNTTVRTGKYNYSTVLEQIGVNKYPVTYKEYVMESLKYYLKKEYQSQVLIDRQTRAYSLSFSQIINNPNVTVEYAYGTTKAKSFMSLQSLVKVIVDNGLRMVDFINKGTFTNDMYLAGMIQDNALSAFSRGVRPTLDSIVSEAYNQISLHESFSTGSLVALISLYTVYFIVLVPFLFITSKDLASMLVLLLDITKQEIMQEHEKVDYFLKKLNKDDKLKDNKSFGGSLEISSEDEEEEKKFVVEENTEDEKEEKKDEVIKSGRTGRDKRHKGNYRRYESNVWQVLFLFGVFSAIAIGIYFALDYVSKSATVVAAFKITELRHLSRNMYANTYSIPYLLIYVLSSKAATCAGTPCSTYLPSFYNLRLGELNTMLIMHKGNVTLLDGEYENLYQNIFEHNPCTMTSLGNVANCSTILGGAFTKGAFSANVMFVDTIFAIYRDYERSNNTLDNLIKFVNDPRLIDMQILNFMLLNPALNLMIDYIHRTLSLELQKGIALTVSLLTVFIIVFLTTTSIWLSWLINFMRTSIYDTKSLLSNLPDEVILRNDTIFRYLSVISPKVNTSISP